MNRREFNTLLSLGTVAQVVGPAIASTPVPGTRKWYETLTPGIHLDYHYPEWDPFLASKADGADMIRKMAETNAKMVVVFAKCHYGNAYYNTRAGHKHKNLGDKDLLREWVTEARQQKLTVLVYYSVDRDVWAGKEHSAWRM